MLEFYFYASLARYTIIINFMIIFASLSLFFPNLFNSNNLIYCDNICIYVLLDD